MVPYYVVRDSHNFVVSHVALTALSVNVAMSSRRTCKYRLSVLLREIPILHPYESNAISVQMEVKRFTHKKNTRMMLWRVDGESIIMCGVHD